MRRLTERRRPSVRATATALALMVSALVGAQAPPAGASAPAWSSPRHDAQNTADNAAETTVTSGNVHALSVGWQSPVYTIGTPIITGGRIYSLCGIGIGAGLCARSETTGKPIWTNTAVGTYDVAAANGLLFLNGGAMTAVRMTDGKVVWQRALTAGATRLYAAPVAAGGLVFYRDDAGYETALDQATGALRWRQYTGDDNSPDGYSATAVVGSTLYDLANGALEVRAMADGHLLWRASTGSSSTDRGQGLSIAAGLVVVPDNEGTYGPSRLLAFKASGCGASYCLPTWTTNTTGNQTLAPAVANGVVFSGDYPRLSAYRLTDGTPLWHYAGTHPVWTAPTVAGDVVYVSTFDGYVLAFRRDGCGTSTCRPLLALNAFGGTQLNVPPVVIDGNVLVDVSRSGRTYTRSYAPA